MDPMPSRSKRCRMAASAEAIPVAQAPHITLTLSNPARQLRICLQAFQHELITGHRASRWTVQALDL